MQDLHMFRSISHQMEVVIFSVGIVVGSQIHWDIVYPR